MAHDATQMYEVEVVVQRMAVDGKGEDVLSRGWHVAADLNGLTNLLTGLC